MSYSFGTKNSWAAWRAGREEGLRGHYGWLSPVELEWIGQAPLALNNFPGTWQADGNEVTLTLPEGEVVFVDEVETAGPVTLTVPPSAHIYDRAGRQAEVMYRFTGPCVRVRDPRAKALEDFAGMVCYGFDPKWVLRGRVLPYPEVRQVTVDTAVPGQQSELGVWADVEVALPDEAVQRLQVVGDGPENSAVIFTDKTNGKTTAAWRSAPVAIDGETVVLDLNRAAMFPAHLTPFGTCPQAPEGNHIPRKVKAGEKRVREAPPKTSGETKLKEGSKK